MAFAYDFKDEDQVKEYLDNLDTEYSFQCYKENSESGCHRLADLWELRSKDYQRAGPLYKYNCDENKYGHSCYKYASYCASNLATKEDNSERTAGKYFEKGCKRDHYPSCTFSGSYLLGLVTKPSTINKATVADPHSSTAEGHASRTDSVSADTMSDKEKGNILSRALADLDKGCANGHVRACSRLAGYYIGLSKSTTNPGDIASGSNSGIPTENSDESSLNRDDGKGPMTALSEAFRYSLRACELEDPQACATVSLMYKRDDGAAPCRDINLSREYRIRAKRLATKSRRGDSTLTFGGKSPS